MLLQTARVLLVDHEPRVFAPLARTLTAEGAYVAIAPNAREAFNLCRRQSFDIVITNSALRDASVDVLVRAIRALDTATVIVATGRGEHLSGADLVLSEPIHPATALRLLRSYETRRAA